MLAIIALALVAVLFVQKTREGFAVETPQYVIYKIKGSITDIKQLDPGINTGYDISEKSFIMIREIPDSSNSKEYYIFTRFMPRDPNMSLTDFTSGSKLDFQEIKKRLPSLELLDVYYTFEGGKIVNDTKTLIDTLDIVAWHTFFLNVLQRDLKFTFPKIKDTQRIFIGMRETMQNAEKFYYDNMKASIPKQLFGIINIEDENAPILLAPAIMKYDNTKIKNGTDYIIMSRDLIGMNNQAEMTIADVIDREKEVLEQHKRVVKFVFREPTGKYVYANGESATSNKEPLQNSFKPAEPASGLSTAAIVGIALGVVAVVGIGILVARRSSGGVQSGGRRR